MTAPTKKIFAVGFNAARLYSLNDSGYVAATTSTYYDGTMVGGPVALSLEFPDPQSIVHPGNNTVLQRDVLPSQDVSSGTLEVSRTDHDTIAMLTNTRVNTIGEANSILWNSNQAGNEPTVGLLAYAQGKLTTGVRGWITYMLRCVIIPKIKGLQRDQANASYFVQPQVSTSHLVGNAFSTASDGATTAEVVEYESNYRLHLTGFKAAASQTVFTFDTALPAVNTAGMVVNRNGSQLTASAGASNIFFTASVGAVTLGSGAAANDLITVMYELDNTAVDYD